MSVNPVPTTHFTDWFNSDERFAVAHEDERVQAEAAWNAACEACAQAQCPMLRSMISRSHATVLCLELRTEPPSQDPV